MKPFKGSKQQVFLFPGIGVKPFGRECLFYARYQAILTPFLDRASALAGVDLGQSLLDRTTFDQDQLSRELFAFAFSCGTFRVFHHRGLRPRLLAGHSMGIYAALVASGALDFDQGLAITEKAHRLGEKYCSLKPFGVVVIIGLNHNELNEIIQQNGYSSIRLANLNNDCSGVYVGLKQETDRLLREADEQGAIKTIPLRISIPFHHPLFMAEVTRKLRAFLGTLDWCAPSCPILSALDHTLLTDIDQLIEMTAANLSRPIHWPGVITMLSAMNIGSVIECGPGVSLTQHAGLIPNAPKHYNLKKLRRWLDY